MRLQTKIGLNILPLVLASIVVLGGWSIRTAERGIEQSTNRYMEMVLSSFVQEEVLFYYEILQKNGLDEVPSFVAEYQRRAIAAVPVFEKKVPRDYENTHFFILRESGEIVIHAGHDELKSPAWAEVAARVAADPAGNKQGSVEDRHGLEHYFAYYFEPWDWVIFVSLSDRDVREATAQIRNVTIGIALLCLIGSFLLIILVLKKFFISPLAELQTGTLVIGSGDLDYRVGTERDDEIGQLSRSFDTMTSALKLVTTSRDKLEQEIAERQKAEQEVVRKNNILDAINRIFQEALICHSLEELGSRCLVVSEDLTGSRFGMIGVLNEEELFDILAISNPGWDRCRLPKVEAEEVLKNMPVRGVDRSTLRDGVSRIINGREAILNHPDHVTPPEGHPPVEAFLGVPLKSEGKTIGMIGLGNKEGGYTLEDQENVEALTVAIVEALKSKRATLELNQLHAELEVRVEQRTFQLEQANVKLLEMDHMKTIFLATMSHELRTPLNAIIGFTTLVRDGMSGEINDQQHAQLDRAVKASRHLLSMVCEIMDITDIEASRVIAEQKPVLLSQLVSEALDHIRDDADQKGLILKTELPAELSIITDQKRLLQCLENLLKNSVKYSEHGTIQVTVRSFDDEVHISVSDCGIGIAAQDLERIFAPFERLRTHLSVSAGGTGLGLYLTRKLAVEVLGGKIEVKSEVGKGSVFTITLPKGR